MRTRRWIGAALGLLVVGCGGGEPAQQATGDSIPAVDAAPSTLTPEQVAGTWNVRAWNEAGDSLPGFTLTATADPAAWTMQFADRPSMPVRAQFSGDSVVAVFGPYESVVRPGVTVETTVVNRLQGDMLVGSLLARYQNAGADSILRGRTEGTKAP